MNLQTQRLLGQQSLAEFMGLHVNLDQVFVANSRKVGPEIQRKNKFIINTGNNMTAEEREKKIKENMQKFGLKPDEIRKLRIPKNRESRRGGQVALQLDQIFHPKSNFSIVEKLNHLHILRMAILRKLERY